LQVFSTADPSATSFSSRVNRCGRYTKTTTPADRYKENS